MAPKKPKTEKAPKPPKAPKEPKAKKGRREVRDNPGLGHNTAEFREKSGPIIEAYLDLKARMESDMAGYRADINILYEESANDLGMKKTVLAKELKRIERAKKEEEKAKKMDEAERAQTELWRSAQVGTQWELFAAGPLPDGPDAPKGEEDPETEQD